MSLKQAIEKLASLDEDFAHEQNKRGFAGYDVSRGHRLAETEKWSKKDYLLALEITKKYMKTQLSEFSYPDFVKEASNIRENTFDDLLITLASLDILESKEVKTQKGMKIVESYNLPYGFWDFWKSHKSDIQALGYSPSKYQGEWSLNKWIDIEGEESKKEESKKVINQPIVLNEEVEKIIDNSILFDYQRAHAKILVSSLINNNVALDASDTGTGKTFTALVVCKALGLRPLIICPKPVIPSWNRSIQTIGLEVLDVVNWELIRTGKTRSGKKTVESNYIHSTKNPIKSKYAPKNIFEFNMPKDGVLIFDEAHRAKNRDSINCEMLFSAANQNCRIMMLSATIAESPLKMFATGRALGFFENAPEYYTKFLPAYGCVKGRFAWELRYQSKITDLHNAIFPSKGDRMKVNDLIKEGKFPESQIIAEPLYMNGETQQIKEAYDEMFSQLKEYEYLSNKKKEYKKHELTESQLIELEEIEEKLKHLDCPLAIRQKARQKIELLKVPLFVEMCEDAIEEGFSVAIFVNYTSTLNAICESLKTDCIINGEISSETKEANRLKFENNESRVIVCNVAASREGIDLHDKYHKFPRMSLINPDDNAQNIKQVLGRVHRTGGTRSIQRMVFVADTIEEEVAANVQAKISRINELNDGDLAVDTFQ